MSKDAYFFPHDSNARHDARCIRLRRKQGLAGYGLYWCVIEMLREADGHRIPMESLADIVFELRSTDEMMSDIFEAGLLHDFGGAFGSPSLDRRMEIVAAKRQQASNAGRKSAMAKINKESTDVERTLNGESTDVERTLNEYPTIKGKESKGKEKKEKDSKDEGKKERHDEEVDTTHAGKKPARSRAPSALVDDDYLSDLEANPGYSGIDIRREYGKMLAWLTTPRGHGKQPTKARFVNWLNRAEPTGPRKKTQEEQDAEDLALYGPRL